MLADGQPGNDLVGVDVLVEASIWQSGIENLFGVSASVVVIKVDSPLEILILSRTLVISSNLSSAKIGIIPVFQH